jgi:hypothetical protein
MRQFDLIKLDLSLDKVISGSDKRIRFAENLWIKGLQRADERSWDRSGSEVRAAGWTLAFAIQGLRHGMRPKQLAFCENCIDGL